MDKAGKFVMTEKMVRKVIAFITFKDGGGQIVEYKLRYNLPFARSEMKKWVIEDNKNIKSVKFLS